MRNLNLNSTDPENASGQGEFRGAVRNPDHDSTDPKNARKYFRMRMQTEMLPDKGNSEELCGT